MKNFIKSTNESKYQEYLESGKIVYPHVNLSVEENLLTVLGEEKPKCVYLPCYDTEELRTSFDYLEGVEYNDTYQKESEVFKAISNMYINDIRYLTIEKQEDNKWLLYVNSIETSPFVYDVTNEPLVVNYLSKLTHQGTTMNYFHFITENKVQLGEGWEEGEGWASSACSNILYLDEGYFGKECNGGLG
jgi:hypothetical protein